MWLISYNGEKQMTFLLIIIVTLNSNPCLFHYKSFVIFYCFYMTILSCRTESKLRYSKKTLWLNHHFMALLSSATQTHLYRTEDFCGLKFATNLQQSCTIFWNFLDEHEADVERAAFPVARVSRWNVLIMQLKAVELRFSFKLCCCLWWTNKVVSLLTLSEI